MSTNEFLPRWASPPGATIRDLLIARRKSTASLAPALGLSTRDTQKLLSGNYPISIALARRLVDAVGGSVGFWIARDAQYRRDLERVQADGWAEAFPVQEMASLGWITRPTGWLDRQQGLLDFFGLRTVGEWQATYRQAVAGAHFRLAKPDEVDAATVSAWLRQADRATSRQQLADWDPLAFSALLPAVKRLSREADPNVFIPRLAELTASAGVSVAVIRAPKGVAVSGAARLRQDGQRQIVLSGRHLADDRLWFTFFHEAGHLLLHSVREPFLEDIDITPPGSRTEQERSADTFAEAQLGLEASLETFAPGPRAAWEIRRLANEAGVSPGIVVGQLQFRGVLGYRTRLNGLKRRYKWAGVRLERA
jgi:plasmid maintenance system antidote protein VapI